MATLSILIVDDEPLARRNLELALADQPGWQVAGSCSSAEQAIRVLDRLQIDLLLLDIAMPGRSGLSLAREILARPQPPLIAFVTAYDEHAIEAFELFAIDYLLKPFDDRRLVALLGRAEKLIGLQQAALLAPALGQFLGERQAVMAGQSPPVLTSLTVRSIGQVERVEVAEIDWIQAAGNYVELHVGERVILHRATMDMLGHRLPPDRFLRLHRTCIARRDLLRALVRTGDKTWSVILRSGVELPASERMMPQIRVAIGDGA